MGHNDKHHNDKHHHDNHHHDKHSHDKHHGKHNSHHDRHSHHESRELTEEEAECFAGAIILACYCLFYVAKFFLYYLPLAIRDTLQFLVVDRLRIRGYSRSTASDEGQKLIDNTKNEIVRLEKGNLLWFNLGKKEKAAKLTTLVSTFNSTRDEKDLDNLVTGMKQKRTHFSPFKATTREAIPRSIRNRR